ncbi:MAG: hypothetical protein AAF191_03950 [Verrucomicrobiota bacterium]
MKTVHSFLLFLLPSLLFSETRTFTSSDGKSLSASLIKVSGNTAYIQIASGKTYQLPLERLSEEDQRYVKDWQKKEEANFIPRLSLDFSSGKGDSKDGTDYDNRSQTLRPGVKVENRELEFHLKGAEGHVFLFGTDVINRRSVKVLSRQNFPIASLAAGQELAWEGKPVKVQYDDNNAARFGHAYSGYLAIITNKSGKILATAGTTSFIKKAEAALELKSGAIADRDLRPAR